MRTPTRVSRAFKSSVGAARRFLSGAAAPARLVAAKPAQASLGAEISFEDGSTYLFHALWLRDSCRDANHTEASSERRLSASPVVTRLPLDVGIKDIRLDENGQKLHVEWTCGDLKESMFEAGFLKALAPSAGKQVIPGSAAPSAAQGPAVSSWFEFLNGKNDSPCPQQADLQLWDASTAAIPRFSYDELQAGRTSRDELLRAIIDPGAVIVQGMPEDVELDGSTLASFAADYLGGLQKHPRRDNAHWTISTNESVGNSNMVGGTRGATNAYDTNKQLCNHTDQSLYGTPGLLLAFHCAHGEGNNSLTDGFAVAYTLRQRQPEAFELLARYGMNAGRYLGYYASGPLLFDTAHPVLQLDQHGSLSRVQYHEIYRTPLTVPYDDFPRYMAALDAFYALVHSPEFQTHLTLHAGECLVMNNWRTMHGRAGLAGKTRTIIGGTVTREAFYSAVREQAVAAAAVPSGKEVGIPTEALVHVGSEVEAASSKLAAHGYAQVRLGSEASLGEMESLARELLGLSALGGGSYNGGGGVSRPTIGDSSFLDAGVGAPPELKIQFHNEMAYASAFPERVAFAMVQPAESDGTTLLVDNVEVTRLLSDSLRARMHDGVRYTRVLHPESARDEPGFYTSWEGAFLTSDISVALEKAAEAGGALEELAGGKFRHTMWSPVFHNHPDHGELFFSSMLNRHASWLDDHAHFGGLPYAERPYHCTWADGSELSADELAELRAVHDACTKHVQLGEGDVLVLDNLRVAHGRTPWAGTGRKLGLLLSEMVARDPHRAPPDEYASWAAAAAAP